MKGAVEGILYHMRSVIVTGVTVEVLHHTAVIAVGLKQHLAHANAFLSFAFTLYPCRICHIYGSHKGDKFSRKCASCQTKKPKLQLLIISLFLGNVSVCFSASVSEDTSSAIEQQLCYIQDVQEG